jgi:L-fuculose-phosphate aldolase
MIPDEVANQVVDLYRAAATRGLISDTAGNVSARLGDVHTGAMAMTPSGAMPDTTGPGDLAHVSMTGATLNSATRSSEWAMHAAVYQTCPGSAFILHTHADACTALACLNERLPPFHYMVLRFGGDDVRCSRYATFGTQALADLTAVAIHGRTACLLANHGMTVSGPTAAQTLANALLLETLCKQYLLAKSAGTPRLLTREEMQGARERFKTYGSRAR